MMDSHLVEKILSLQKQDRNGGKNQPPRTTFRAVAAQAAGATRG